MPPPRKPQAQSSIGWWLLVLLLIGVGISVYLWAPWQNAAGHASSAERRA
jgi:hypothetical protein